MLTIVSVGFLNCGAVAYHTGKEEKDAIMVAKVNNATVEILSVTRCDPLRAKSH